jgi:iron complex transport system substrate-binding protein
MSNRLHRLAKPFLAMAFSLFLVTACTSLTAYNFDKPVELSKPAVECQIVQHKVGTSCIPVQPQRIITLEVSWILDPLLSLGVKPVGTVSSFSGGREYFPGLSADDIAGIENVGTPSGSSLEKILKLKPDLILSLDFGEQIYDQLSAIAPTVVREYEKIKFSFKENFRSIAQLVGQARKAEEVLAQYQERVEGFREQLKNQPNDPEISVINYLSGAFLSPPYYAPFFQVLSDIGVRLKS